MFGRNRERPVQINSFSIVTLRESGMRGSNEYEIVMKNDEAEVSHYLIRYSQGEDKRVLDKRAVCGKDVFIRLLNDCSVFSWNGFSGKHPKGVLDGIMFRFDAVVNQEEKIHADGSANFPKHYREFTDGLYAILNNKE